MAAVLLGFATLAVTTFLCKQFLPGTFQRIQQRLPGRQRRAQIEPEPEPAAAAAAATAAAVISLRYPNADGFTAPACEIYARARGSSSIRNGNATTEVLGDGTTVETTQVQTQVADTNTDNKRLIALGDVHGSLEGLLENLYNAGITDKEGSCEWQMQAKPTILVQVGDIVDRGPSALEAFVCLQHLQKTAPQFNGEVVRLFGNHELWWLTGILYKRNPHSDTREKITELVELLVADIANDLVKGAYVNRVRGVPVLFVHAGFNAAYYEHLSTKLLRGTTNNFSATTTTTKPRPTAEALVAYTNKVLKESVAKCKQFPCDKFSDGVNFSDGLFQAGPDRGGSDMGGPFWTDFSTLEAAAEKGEGPLDFIQVVGHTMAWCYNPRSPGTHPPEEQAECSLGLVRASPHILSVCVDGGMYLGARAYLEIDEAEGAFVSHQRLGDKESTPWEQRDLTTEACLGS